VVKKLENFWKGLWSNKSQISPVRPQLYGVRFLGFIKGITLSKEEVENGKATEDSSSRAAEKMPANYRSTYEYPTSGLAPTILEPINSTSDEDITEEGASSLTKEGRQSTSSARSSHHHHHLLASHKHSSSSAKKMSTEHIMSEAENEVEKSEKRGRSEEPVRSRTITTVRSPSAERSGGTTGQTLPVVEEAAGENSSNRSLRSTSNASSDPKQSANKPATAKEGVTEKSTGQAPPANSAAAAESKSDSHSKHASELAS
jgi:1-phosphatidylinositol-4-phosphate 5-kinase